MKELNYLDAMAIATDKLTHGGIFLTSKNGETQNTMTIGWAAIGYCWKYPVFIALVRPQRFSYGLIRDSLEFTVSVPTKNPLKAELAMAGTKSGRDIDKFSGRGLTAAPAIAVGAPIIAECGIHFECRVRLTQNMTGERMDSSVIDYAYEAGDFHTMFYGEILKCYTTDD